MNYIEFSMKEGAKIIFEAAKKAYPDASFDMPLIEEPKDLAFGDFASGFAMKNAKNLGAAPRQIAQNILDNADFSGSLFTHASIAGAGFINLHLDDSWYSKVLEAILSEAADFGRTVAPKKEKIMVEFVSANPTGPMHMGNARGGVLGDSLAKVLSLAGHDVTKEFYVNDSGNQIEKFAQSLSARYMQLVLGEDGFEFPADGYMGEDIKDIARAFYAQNGDKYKDDFENLKGAIADFGLKINIPKMESDLKRYKIEYDCWFYESSLYESGEVRDTVELLKQKGATYESEGALWLKSTDFGCEKDDVLVRANGFYTYFAADIAYHRNKLVSRGFDRVINIWGADHHGHVLRLKKALDALGLDGSNRLEIIIMQMVNLMQDGKVARMSKRTGKAITLSDLLDDIPVDAARFFFNNRDASSHLDFDLDLAIRQDSENPVYYVQYAHARIMSILKALKGEGIDTDITSADLSLLSSGAEKALIREISRLPEEIRLAGIGREPSRINRYASAVAAAFHKFYTDCRIKDSGSNELMNARILLCKCTATVIKNTLDVFGVSAPDHM